MAQPIAISRQREMQPSTPDRPLPKGSRIVMLLTKLAIRRQVKVSEPEFVVYAEDLLSYELDDIATVLEKIGMTEREEGETSFPTIAKVINRITSVVNSRKRAERELKERLEQEEKDRLYEEDLRLNPEKYAARDREFDEKMAALSAKFDIARKSAPPPTPAPVMTDSPIPKRRQARRTTGAIFTAHS